MVKLAEELKSLKGSGAENDLDKIEAATVDIEGMMDTLFTNYKHSKKFMKWTNFQWLAWKSFDEKQILIQKGLFFS